MARNQHGGHRTNFFAYTDAGGGGGDGASAKNEMDFTNIFSKQKLLECC